MLSSVKEIPPNDKYFARSFVPSEVIPHTNGNNKVKKTKQMN